MNYITTHTHENGLDYIDIDSPLCDARIFIQGAQIVHFQPKGQQPLLWVSAADDYQPGNGIRGGVPICWPWFGQHSNKQFPQHGFARTSIWDLASITSNNDIVTIKFTLAIDEKDLCFWPHNTKLEMEFVVGKMLQMNLINTNLSDETIELTQALHSYFPIGNIHELIASGFADAKYIEFNQGPFPQPKDQVQFDKETDRVYTDLGSIQYLNTANGVIEVKRKNSQSAVLWNPWIDKSKRLSRFNDNDYLSMVCLEAANVLEDKVILKPGQSHQLTNIISWK